MSKLAEMILKNAEHILKNIDLCELNGKSILITGASGLLGIHMLACLKKIQPAIKPDLVAAVINREPLPYLKEMTDYPQARIYQGDLSDVEFCKSLPMADVIIHTAGYGQPIRFMENAIKTLKINTLAMYMLFDKLMPGGKFLFISTSEVYTGLSRPPFREKQIGTTNTDHPRSCYIEGKRCGEAIVNAQCALGVNAKYARLALAYGPGTRLDDKRVISSFIEKGFEGKIMLMDYGKAMRAYLYVTDAVEILWKILLTGKQYVYNVGGISRKTIGEMAQTLGAIMNVPVIFPYYPQEIAGGPKEAWLDMTRVEQEFGKSEYVSLEDGLKQTVQWYNLLREQK